jgi:ABC-type microcin C transport system permease subunit YejE
MTSTVLPFAAGATVVVVLGLGLWNLGRRNPSPSLSQTLMRWRVGLQFLTIVIAVLMVWLLKSGTP